MKFLQHRIFIDTKNQYIPQLSNDYKKGYDQLTNGLSTQFIIDYMILEEEKRFKFFAGIDYTLGFTKNKRTYDFNNMNITDKSIRYDKLLGFHIGLIIPINRKNNTMNLNMNEPCPVNVGLVSIPLPSVIGTIRN